MDSDKTDGLSNHLSTVFPKWFCVTNQVTRLDLKNLSKNAVATLKRRFQIQPAELEQSL